MRFTNDNPLEGVWDEPAPGAPYRPPAVPRFPATVRVLVRSTLDGAEPARVEWEGRAYAVAAVLCAWKEMGRWWDGEGDRNCYRLELRRGKEVLLLEVEYRHESKSWWARRTLD